MERIINVLMGTGLFLSLGGFIALSGCELEVRPILCILSVIVIGAVLIYVAYGLEIEYDKKINRSKYYRNIGSN